MMTKRLLAIAVAIALAVPAARAFADESVAENAWESLKEGNAAFRNDPGFTARRATLLEGQSPKAIVLSCADSRVPPEHVFGQGLGDLFVVRLAGNYPAPGTIGSIEYAVEHLGTKLLVVLGHRKCGAVKAAVDHAHLPEHSDLEWLVEQIAPAVEVAKANPNPNQSLLDGAIEANADLAARKLLEKSEIIRHAVETGEVRLVVAIYDLESGKVRLQPFVR